VAPAGAVEGNVRKVVDGVLCEEFEGAVWVVSQSVSQFTISGSDFGDSEVRTRLYASTFFDECR